MTYEEIVAYAQGVATGRPVRRQELERFMGALLTQLGEQVPPATAYELDGAWRDEVVVTPTKKMHISPRAVRTYNRREAEALAEHIAAVSQILE